MNLTATVLKTTGQYFYILPEGEDEVIPATARGRIKITNKIYPGDKVLFSKDENQCVIEKILPRKNLLPRPNVANVDELVVVVSLKKPDVDYIFVDRLLVLGESLSLPIIICLNKIDLNGDLGKKAEEIYQNIGYRLVITSALENIGLDKLKVAITEKVAVLVGLSGVGKSTILNSFNPNWGLATSEVSHKLKRGRHTTKHVELFPWEKGLITDTPGFSRLNIANFVNSRNLAKMFREFADYSGKCRYDTCIHHKEPGCGVKDALEAGLIEQGRYINYLKFLEEIDENG